MDKIKTASGKEFSSDYLTTIPSPAQMFVRVIGAEFSTVKDVFGNPEETRQISYGARLFTGYTRMISAFREDDAIKIILAKE